MLRKVLIVDDEPKILSSLARHLVGRFQVNCAGSGAEALRLFEQEGPFPVVISDMRMPGMDGVTLLHELRRRVPDTICLVVSGHCDLRSLAVGVRNGDVFQFHAKPIMPDALYESVDRAFMEHRRLRMGTMIDREKHWQMLYESRDETAVSWFEERPAISVALVTGTGFGPEARFVDVGGGASRLADNLIALGYTELSVLDVADAALVRTRARLGKTADLVEWITADVTLWHPISQYDIWHDRAAFHFLTEAAERKAYLSVLKHGLRTGGHAIIGTFALDGPERCSGLPVCRYSATSLASEFGPSFRLDEVISDDHVTPTGGVQKFLFCRLVKVD